mmetsp:Transcript_11637/g.17362  ORF Transcript_11637/g.17362 Transcript_11637/m.17362 type:complete len:86 (+) Transcript_11637:857-1114(+)
MCQLHQIFIFPVEGNEVCWNSTGKKYFNFNILLCLPPYFIIFFLVSSLSSAPPLKNAQKTSEVKMPMVQSDPNMLVLNICHDRII